jgi:hypothetical protein
LWLIVSAFVFDTALAVDVRMSTGVVWNQVISGAICSILAAMSALARRPYTRTGGTDDLLR